MDSDCNIILTGTVSGVSGTTTMKFMKDDLMNPTGIYGGNCPFYLNGATTPINPQNNVYGWVTGDLFSGMNIGAVGSQIPWNGTMVGAMESQNWFQIPVNKFFANLQPNNRTNYNQWAATLSTLSNAYNFAYTDRFDHVLVSLNPATVDTLQIVLENASVVMNPTMAAMSEMQ